MTWLWKSKRETKAGLTELSQPKTQTPAENAPTTPEAKVDDTAPSHASDAPVYFDAVDEDAPPTVSVVYRALASRFS